MSRRSALVTQAEIARAVRATMAAGLTVVRVVTRPDGVAIETGAEKPGSAAPPADPPRKPIIL